MESFTETHLDAVRVLSNSEVSPSVSTRRARRAPRRDATTQAEQAEQTDLFKYFSEDWIQ